MSNKQLHSSVTCIPVSPIRMDSCWGEILLDRELTRRREATKKMNKNETRIGEYEHTKDEVKARRLKDAAALECMRSPPSSVVVEKIKVRFLRIISMEHASDMPSSRE